MEDISENDQREIEAIGLGQEFQPFTLKVTRFVERKGGLQTARTQILLRTAQIRDFPFVLEASKVYTAAAKALNPFSLEELYTVADSTDVDRVRFRPGLSPLSGELLEMRGECTWSQLSDFGIPGFYDDRAHRFTENVEGIFERLRLRLSFPNGIVFEARPDMEALTYASLQFTQFYPKSDENVPPEIDTKKPYALHLPPRKELLRRINAYFFLAESHEIPQGVLDVFKDEG